MSASPREVWRRWWPASATLLVAAACLAFGRTPLTLQVAIAAGMLAAALVVPPLGLVVLMVGSLASPFAIPTWTHTAVPYPLIAVAALTAVWLIGAIWRRDLHVFELPAVAAVCVMAVVAAVATVVANIPSAGFGRTAPLAAQLGGLAVFLCSAATVVLAADGLRDAGWLRRVVWLYLAFTAVLVGFRVIPEVETVRLWLFDGDANGSLTWVWFAALAGAQALANRSLPWRVRLLLGLAVVSELAFGLDEGRYWVSGWLPPLVASVVVVCLSLPRLGAVLLGLAGIAAAAKLPALIARVLGGDNQYSFDTRLEAWRILLGKVVPVSPLLGLGPANYYHVTPLFPIRGYSLNFSSHSTYVDLLAQTGLVGAVCFAWFVWAVTRTGWRLHVRQPPGFARAYAIGALAGLVGMLTAGGLGDWVMPFVYNLTLNGTRASLPGWLFLGGLLAVSRAVEPNVVAATSVLAPRRWTTARVLVGIIAVAVVLRLAVAIALGDAAPPISGAADQFSYDTLAMRVVNGFGFSFPTAWYPFAKPETPTAHWSYLYTLYLAAVYAVCGHHPLAARLLQALASGAACWLVFRIGRRLFDESVGLAAAALTATYAYFVFFNAALMTQTFFIVALLAALDRALAIAERPTAAAWATLGACLGAGVLLRQTLLLYIPLLLAWLGWSTRGRARGRDFALAIGLIALCVLPWTARNYAAYGDFLLLNSNGGYFLYASNHPNQGTSFDPVHLAPVPAEVEPLNEAEADRVLLRQAVGFIIADPVRFLRLSWSRAGYYFALWPSVASTPLANAARLCSFALYLPLMVYGLALSLRRWRMCVPLYLYLLVDTALHLGSWAAPRYRLPSDALLMVFAGAALVALLDCLRRWWAVPERSPAIAAGAASPRAARTALIGLALVGGLIGVSDRSAGAKDAWSPPERVFLNRDIRTTKPQLVTDSAGGAHLFFVVGNRTEATPTVLMYSRRSPTGWTTPVAVLSANGGNHLGAPWITLDADGWFHVVYQGVSTSPLLYRRVHVSEVTDPHAWTRIRPLTDEGVFASRIVAAPGGRLHVVYANSRQGDTFYQRSDDGGRHWQKAVRVSHVDHTAQAADGPYIAVDSSGRLHAVWTQLRLPDGWPPTGVFYSRSLDDGVTWEPPRQLAGEGYAEISVLARGPDEVHLLWNAYGQIGDRMHAWSSDGGDTWSTPKDFATGLRGGITGSPFMAVDSQGTLHAITSVSGPESIERVFHTTWDGSRWSEPQLISAGTDAVDSVEFPHFAIGDGNHLYVTFEVDYRGIWVAEGRADAPALAPRPIPTRQTGLRAAFDESSLPLRIALAVAGLMAVEAVLEYSWRLLRRLREN